MKPIFLFFLFICSYFLKTIADPYPIQFSIPESKIVSKIPEKDRDFAFIIPGDLSTYIYENESDYYKDYQRSYFALTRKKAGCDCMRHYEILANGCIPYFVDLDECDENTMFFLPKELIKEAMSLEGVSYLHIDHNKFNREKYEQILQKMLDYTREYLTTRKMAEYILQATNYSGNGKILFLSNDPSPDYMRCLTLIGFKELLGDRVIDVPKIEHIYTNYPHDIRQLYGKGVSYTKIVEDLPIDRNHIAQRIQRKEFDLIIYGSVHRGLKFYNLVKKVYEPERIIYLCGEDYHRCEFAHLNNFFLREFQAIR